MSHRDFLSGYRAGTARSTSNLSQRGIGILPMT